ncbi:hypothetical protein Celaphus_00010165 [Cervus elaphus hippelaphus]|uniref:Uncharacterized protein n=1 Tax=Cervus elaphus hippelaphus TaxID=46360 RepID=A0A212BZH0_CEREH|nr:hypothetical protein Celaphus_00010165 [Cervus elaphus hippelaphus]
MRQVAHQASRLPSAAGKQWRQERPWKRERWWGWLLVEVIIEEVEGVAEEEQEKVSSQEREEEPEEQVQEHSRTGASGAQPPLAAQEALAALQVELRPTNEKDPRA